MVQHQLPLPGVLPSPVEVTTPHLLSSHAAGRAAPYVGAAADAGPEPGRALLSWGYSNWPRDVQFLLQLILGLQPEQLGSSTCHILTDVHLSRCRQPPDHTTEPSRVRWSPVAVAECSLLLCWCLLSPEWADCSVLCGPRGGPVASSLLVNLPLLA